MDNKYTLVYGSIGKKVTDEVIIDEPNPKPLLYIKETNQWFDGSKYYDADTVEVFPFVLKKRCGGVSASIGGYPVDNCLYEEIERIPNCTVSVLQCTRCGHIEIEWEREGELGDAEEP